MSPLKPLDYAGYPDRTPEEALADHARVREIHKPEVIQTVEFDCYAGDCDHESECPTTPTVVCEHCYQWLTEQDDEAAPGDAEWPCRTAEAMGA